LDTLRHDRTTDSTASRSRLPQPVAQKGFKILLPLWPEATVKLLAAFPANQNNLFPMAWSALVRTFPLHGLRAEQFRSETGALMGAAIGRRAARLKGGRTKTFQDQQNAT
jgi:hypothetical protein